MMQDLDLYQTQPVHRERNEDGDIVVTWEVIAKGFDGARAFIKQFDRSPEFWSGMGDGWLKATYFTVIDGAEDAIERQNDEWASRQQEIEDRGRAGFLS